MLCSRVDRYDRSHIFFFFQAEDGIRGGHVTGVQTCALPILFNDWSARDVQAREMRVRLGPAKGKDFATTLGPWIVTADEFEALHDDEGFLPIIKIGRASCRERE